MEMFCFRHAQLNLEQLVILVPLVEMVILVILFQLQPILVLHQWNFPNFCQGILCIRKLHHYLVLYCESNTICLTFLSNFGHTAQICTVNKFTYDPTFSPTSLLFFIISRFDLSAGPWPSMTAELCTSLSLLHVFYFSRVFFNVVFELIGENVFLFNYFRILRLRGPKVGLYVSINYRLDTDSIIQSVQWSRKVKTKP